MKHFSPDEIHERLRLAGEEWADKDAAASALEETRKTLLAELFLNAAPSTTVKESEMRALADPAYKLHTTNMVAARKEANRAKVRYETARVWAELRRSLESTRRAEMMQQ
jgi:hypothetical protein